MPLTTHSRRERKGKDRKGKERKGKERKGKEREGKEKATPFSIDVFKKPSIILGCPGQSQYNSCRQVFLVLLCM